MRRFRLTIYFVLTVLAVLTVITFLATHIGSAIAEENLTAFTQENTAREALHIQSMATDTHDAHRGAIGAGEGGAAPEMPDAGRISMTLDQFVGPGGLVGVTQGQLTALGIVKMSVLALDGNVVWSTDPTAIGSRYANQSFLSALGGEVASKLVRGHVLAGTTGVPQPLDVVETYVPWTAGPNGRAIGVLAINRDVTAAFGSQVMDSRRRILLLIAGFTGTLFLVFAVFIVLADVTIHRARRRELDLVENQTTELLAERGALRESETAAASLAQQNAVLAEIGRIISSSLNVEEVYERFAEQAAQLIPFDRIVVTVLDRSHGMATASYVRGVAIPGKGHGETHAVAGTLTETVVRMRSGFISTGNAPEARVASHPEEADYISAGLQSVMAVPLVFNESAIGTLTLRSTAPDAYSSEHLVLGERIGVQISGTLARSHLYIERRLAEEEAVQAAA